MRLPRVRITIGRLLILVPLSGLVIWGMADVVLPRFGQPTLAERQADASYKQASLVREVAEYAVKEFKVGTLLQMQRDLSYAEVALKSATREREDSSRRDARTLADFQRRLDAFREVKRARAELERARAEVERARDRLRSSSNDRDTLPGSLLADVEMAKAEELAKAEALRLERIRRGRSLLGF